MDGWKTWRIKKWHVFFRQDSVRSPHANTSFTSPYSQRWRSRMSRIPAHVKLSCVTNNRDHSADWWDMRKEWREKELLPPTPLCPSSVPDVTDLSGMSRAALPSPARATAFELLLAVMFISRPAAHLMDKRTKLLTQPSPNLNLDTYRFFLQIKKTKQN